MAASAPACKIRKQEHSESTERTGQVMSSSQSQYGNVDVPASTCTWKQHHLLALNINIEHHLSPIDIVDLLIKGRLKEGPFNANCGRTKANLDARVGRIELAVKETLAFQLLNNQLDAMTMQDDIISVFHSHEEKMWKLENIDDETRFKTLFQSAGPEFIQTLLYMIDTKSTRHSRTFSEDSYQHLFVSFLRLFGLTCQFNPVIGRSRLSVGGLEVSGIPDLAALLLRRSVSVASPSSFEWKTLFICKTKKVAERDDTPHASGTRRGPKRPAATSNDDPDDMLGQIGAELLLYRQSSLAEGVIIGINLEETSVTFTALAMTERQYRQIIEDGSTDPDTENGPKLFVSKPYNYLVKKDREHLLEAFFKLGFLQKYGAELF